MINYMFYINKFRYGWTGVMLLMISACGSPPARIPVALEQAGKADQAAHRAMRDGDLMRAREMFQMSTLMYRSVENIPAAAMSSINLSSVSHRLGDSGTALDLLNGVLSDDTTLVPLELRTAAAFRKGIILADMNKPDEAELALEQAQALCKNQCGNRPGLNNLKARLLLERNDYSGALALAMGVSGADKEEQANALRIAGTAESALGQTDASIAHFKAALILDKELALGNRIADDLKGIARSLDNSGHTAEAAIYLHRAENVDHAAKALRDASVQKSPP